MRPSTTLAEWGRVLVRGLLLHPAVSRSLLVGFFLCLHLLCGLNAFRCFEDVAWTNQLIRASLASPAAAYGAEKWPVVDSALRWMAVKCVLELLFYAACLWGWLRASLWLRLRLRWVRLPAFFRWILPHTLVWTLFLSPLLLLDYGAGRRVWPRYYVRPHYYAWPRLPLYALLAPPWDSRTQLTVSYRTLLRVLDRPLRFGVEVGSETIDLLPGVNMGRTRLWLAPRETLTDKLKLWLLGALFYGVVGGLLEVQHIRHRYLRHGRNSRLVVSG